jgi:hypothetical protein
VKDFTWEQGKEVLEQFKSLGMKASFHFAAEYPNEDQQAYSAKYKAMELFKEHKNLREDMARIAKGFIWVSSFERDRANIEKEESE